LRGKSLTIVAEPHHPHGWKAIHWTKRIESIYTFGAEVMPSTNYGTVVLFAKRIIDDKEVVVKVREKAKTFRTEEFERSWRHTTEIILNLPRHEHITEIFEVLEDEKAYYVIMERAEGMDLFETLVGPHRPSRPEIQDILRKLLDAVAALHEKGFVHRDLKLENIMVDRTPKSGSSTTVTENWEPAPSASSMLKKSKSMASECSVKLIDFDTVEELTPMTPKSKLVLGTDMYIPVEAYSGHYSPASDIFSIGVIAYKLLTGRYPFADSCFPDDKGDNTVGSPTMITTQKNLKDCVVDWNVPPFNDDEDARDLVRSMMNMTDDKRPTAIEALEHRWFATTIID
jgi:serine/threonine protein kinase